MGDITLLEQQMIELQKQLARFENQVDTTLLERQIIELRGRTDDLIDQQNWLETILRQMIIERDNMLQEIMETALFIEQRDRVTVSYPDDAECVFISAGLIIPGPPRESDKERQKAERFVRSFLLDKYPVTNAQFARFVEATNYVTLAEKQGKPNIWGHPDGPDSTIVDDHPVVCVYREDAQAYAAWAGRRLPTRLEWERAMRGVAGQAWPWGNEWGEGRCNLAGQVTTAVHAYPEGVSPVGCWDMVGNVWEWLADELLGGKLLLMGGSWAEQRMGMPVGYKLRIAPGDGTDWDIGFRCAKDVPSEWS